MHLRTPFANTGLSLTPLSPSTQLVRTGTIAGLLAGALLLIADLWSLLDYLRYGDSQAFSSVATTTGYMVMAGMYLAAALLLLLALFGQYARPLEAAGALGRASLVLALIGGALLVALAWSMVFVVPSAALKAPAFLDAEEVAGPLDLGFMTAMSTFAAGWVLVGVAAFRSRLWPRSAAALLILGALLIFAPFPASTLVFDVAIVWLGLLALRSRTPATSPEAGGLAQAS